MPKYIKRILPAVAVVAMAAAIGGFLVVRRDLAGFRTESPETRRAMEAAATGLVARAPASLDDADFRAAVQTFARSQHVVQAWLVHMDGRILASFGGVSREGRVQGMSTEETRRILGGLPVGFLSPVQEIALQTASAIQSEGEHNDVFRHMVRPLADTGGRVLGFVAFTYDVNPAAGTFPGYGYAVALLLIPLGFGVYWLALPWWVLLDAKERGERAAVWAFFVLLGNLFALFAYLLTRRPSVDPRELA